MNEGIYCIYNSIQNRYVSSFQKITDLEASIYLQRSLEFVYDEQTRKRYKNPDYEKMELCKIAEVDIQTGVVTALPAPIRIDKYVPTVEAREIDNIEQNMQN